MSDAQPRQARMFLRTLVINTAIPLVTILLLGLLLGWQFAQVRTQAAWVTHSLEVQRQDFYVATLLNRIESGQRGYMLTRDLEFRKLYDDSKAELAGTLDQLRKLTDHNPTQASRVARVAAMYQRWDLVAQREMALAIARDPHFIAYLTTSGNDDLMAAMRQLLKVIRADEEQLLQRRQDQVAYDSKVGLGVGVGGLLISMLFFGLFSMRQYRLLHRSFQENMGRMAMQNRALTEQAEELTAQSEELAMQSEELQDFADQMRSQNDILEQRVEERTEELSVAKEAAEGASRAKSAFLANMSHELRTPLNAILGYSEMLAEEAEETGQDANLADLKKIHAAGKHLLSLINDILDLSKIEAGKMDLYLEDIDPSVLVGEVTATIRPLVDRNHNTLVLEVEPGLGVMKTDVTKLRQVLFNLLSNAAKFTENGTVTLKVSPGHPDEAGEWVRFAVTDTGIGLSSEQVSGLYQEFSQADASTTRKYGGTGLGLAISRRFCQLLGGDIVVTSTPGQGSTFTVCLPLTLTMPEGLEAGVAQAAPNETIALNGKQVLVIDDDPQVHDLMSRYLTREGYRVRVALNGQEGLRIAREWRPDAITLDVMMAGLDGWAVLSALKAAPDLADIPVVMVTMVDDKTMGFALGAAEYMVKPIDRNRLTTALMNILPNAPHGPILVVDDEPDNRELVRAMLEKEGLNVVEARNGKEALAVGLSARPALIVLDLLMPEMDGFEFMDEASRRPELRNVPIIVLTALDLGASERERLSLSVQGVLQKASYRREALLTQVKRLLETTLATPPAAD